MIINTEQLHLRLANENDIPNMQKYFAVWEVMKHMNDHGSWPYPEDGAEKFYHDTIKPNQNKNRWFWAINEKNNPDYMIGEIELDRELPEEGENIGFWLGTPYHGKGYMSEALSAVVDFAFAQQNFDFLRINAATTNPASRRIQEKCGFKNIARKKYSTKVYSGDYMTDEQLLTLNDWLKLKKK